MVAAKVRRVACAWRLEMAAAKTGRAIVSRSVFSLMFIIL
jgi:hypothetical protein